MGFWDDDLTEYDEEYDAMPEEGANVEDGKYEVTVVGAELTESKKSGAPMIKWTLKIDGPRYIGRFLWRYNLVATTTNREWLKKDLAVCGLRIPFSAIRDRIGEVVGTRMLVSKVTKNDYENVYFNKRLDDDAPAGSVTPDAVLPARASAAGAKPKAPASNLDDTDDDCPF